jgi:glutathione S-transferase
MALTLVVANKNYSSWSMRPWVLMRQLGIGFTERRLSFVPGQGAAFGESVRRISPAGRVPVLIDHGDHRDHGDHGALAESAPLQVPGQPDIPAGLVIWDSLAIVEHLHERFAQRGVWPAALAARSRARSVAAEMHAGFGALRSHCPMNIEADLSAIGPRLLQAHAALRADLARVDALWCAALASSGGPFLFGAFSAADAFYAPVALRLRGYGLPASSDASAYIERLLAAPGPAAWIEQALQEHEWVAEDEPYRQQPGAGATAAPNAPA